MNGKITGEQRKIAAHSAANTLPPIRIKKNGRGAWLRTGRRGVRFIGTCHPGNRHIGVGLVGYGRFGKPVVEGFARVVAKSKN